VCQLLLEVLIAVIAAQQLLLQYAVEAKKVLKQPTCMHLL
jgi:hypothetical protein